jgi:hypothetical protein
MSSSYDISQKTLKNPSPTFEHLNEVRDLLLFKLKVYELLESLVNRPSHVWSQHQFAIPRTVEWVCYFFADKSTTLNLVPRDLRKLGMNLIPFPRVRFAL